MYYMAAASAAATASPPSAGPGQSLQASLSHSASSGQTAAIKELIGQGADVNALDAQGLTPLMLAVLGGHLDTAVKLALSGADLGRRDSHGRTALELAVIANNREAALALLLIATGKFTRPLSPLLPPATLLRLQHWVLDRTGKNGKAAAVVRRHPPPACPGRCNHLPSCVRSARARAQNR